MRSALICVFFTLVVQGRSQTEEDDFKPTPIPLNDWHPRPLHGVPPAGTLHEVIDGAEPAVVAAVPAHYWEDALRHSVYLTLVRDKIDRLIAKGTVMSPNNQPDPTDANQIDDHDLWQKIKTAPFDRTKEEEPASFGDVTIMAKGRLLEANGGFRFAEDETSKDKCTDDKCTEGVKAFWSVKRVRQRDVEATPGKYHYELTFSVTQASKQPKKPYENPIRTFTVRESTPANLQPEHQNNEPKYPVPRPARAVWFHKNIAQAPRYQARQYHQGLDRIFSSIFDDDDTSYRHKPTGYVTHSFPQHFKAAHVGSSSEQHQQKRLMTYNNYKPQTYKYPRPLAAPPVPHYVDFDSFSNQYTSGVGDQRFVSSTPIKTTRPAVLPTPPVSLPAQRNFTMEVAYKSNQTEPLTTPGVVTPPKTYNKAKPTPMKISYFTDHVRPPVFNAPPGVFVTMDKKPFKPLPPLKMVQSSNPKRPKPSDFRPSPQVLDVQFSDPDPVNDNAFRPITMNYHDVHINDTTTEDSYKGKHNRRKPPKKHGNIKSQHSTVAPDIITASSSSVEEEDTLQWANVVSAFTKTTPMVSYKEKINTTERIDIVTTTDSPTTVSSTKVAEITTTSTTTPTTPKPKKRTRPPPTFTKTEKKKHKRTTTTTTTTTKAPEKATQRPSQDLTPQASSSITGSSKNKIVSTTPLATTTSVTTTSAKPTTETVEVNNKEDVNTTPPNARNRFRQSTLMHKGTSVNHDKWSATNIEKSKFTGSKNPGRRKGSNFQGYLPSSTPRTQDKERKRNHEDHVSSTHATNSNENIEVVSKTENTSLPTVSTNEVHVNQSDKSTELNLGDLESYYTNNPEEYEDEEEGEDIKDNDKEADEVDENDEQEYKDHAEYIFNTGTTATTIRKTENEIIEIQKPETTQMPVVISPLTNAKNKTKCKKKNLHNLTTTEHTMKESKQADIELTNFLTSTTTESTTASDIFEELFGGFSNNEAQEKPEEYEPTQSELVEGESAKNEKYAHVDKELAEFLDSLDQKEKHSDESGESDEYEEHDREFSSEEEEEDSPFNYDDDIRSKNTKDESDDEYHSLLELMAME